MDELIVVVGAKGKIDVEKVIKKLRRFCTPCQIFDADVICGKEHIIAAYHHAKKSMEYGNNIAKSIDMEILLYVSARRQIEEAIKFAGAKDNGRYAFLFCGKNEEEVNDFIKKIGLIRDDEILKPNVEKIKRFGINEKELKTISKSKYADLVLEKMAMLNAIK